MSFFILPVSGLDAVNWARGNMDDKDLLLRAELCHQAVWLCDLPNHDAVRGVLKRLRLEFKRGAQVLVFRTRNPIVERYMVRRGAAHTVTDTDGQKRFLIPPKPFAEWMVELESPTLRKIKSEVTSRAC